MLNFLLVYRDALKILRTMTCASFGPINLISTQILWKLFVHVPCNF